MRIINMPCDNKRLVLQQKHLCYDNNGSRPADISFQDKADYFPFLHDGIFPCLFLFLRNSILIPYSFPLPS